MFSAPPPWIVLVMFFIAFSLLFEVDAFKFLEYYTTSNDESQQCENRLFFSRVEV